MARYIDADALKREVNVPDDEINALAIRNSVDKTKWERLANSIKAARDGFLMDIDDAPTADVAPVVHARWEVKAEPPEYNYMTVYCTNCGEELVIEANNEAFENYCPECGARMDEEVE